MTRCVHVGVCAMAEEGTAVKTIYVSCATGIGYAMQAVEKYCQEPGYDAGIIAPLFRLHFVYRACLKSMMVSFGQ